MLDLVERCGACGSILAGEIFIGVLQIGGTAKFCRSCSRDALDRLDRADTESIDLLDEAWWL
jgi:hypothetical protein